MGPTPDAGAGCRRGARPVIGPLPRPTGFFSALPLALPLAVPLAIFTALAASATATPAAAVEPSLPRVEIIPAAPGPASPPWADEPPGTASPRSITWVDLSTGDWTAATDWRDLAIEVPGLFVRVGDGGLSTSYALRGHALTRTLLDGLPDVMRLFVRDPATVRQVRVVGGAAGVDQGIGSPGGLLAMVTPLPGDRPGRRIDLQLGAHGARRLVLDLDQPLATDWRSRLVLASQDGRSQPGDLTQRRDHLLGTLAWLPRARPEDGGLRGVAERQISRMPYGFGTVLTPDGRIRYDQLYASPSQTAWRGVSQVALHGWWAWRPAPDQRLSLRADLADAVGHRDETLIGAWDQRSDGDLNGYYTRYTDNHRQRSARLEVLWQLDTDGTRHDTRIGLDRLRRHWLFTGVQNVGGYRIDADAPDFSGVDPDALAMSPRHRHQHLREASRYLRHRITWPGDAALSLGLRQIAFDEASAAPGAPFIPVHELDGAVARVHEVGLEARLSPDWQAAFSAAQGIEPNTGRSRSGEWLPPRRSALLEGVLRQTTSEGEPSGSSDPTAPAGWQVGIYRLRLEGLTRIDPQDRNVVVADAARVVRGIEVARPWRIGPWTLSTQFSALRLRWLQPTSASVGKLPVNQPQRTAGLRLERRIDLGNGWQDARVWLQGQARSALYADSANRRRLPGTAIADVGLQARQGDWQLTLLLRNLADRDHVASVSSVDEVYQGSTRQWRCTLSRRW